MFDFDNGLAILLGKACQYAYDLPPALPVVFQGCTATNCDDQNDPTKSTSFVSVLAFPDKTIVAFQGTITRELDQVAVNDFQAVRDWMENFRTLLVPGDSPKNFNVPGRVHAGFASQLDVILKQLLHVLDTVKNRPIYITGHSQGGAVAAIATKALAAFGLPVKATYTFAAPRAGNAQFAESVDTEVHRLEFGDDIVPHVPMRADFPGTFAKVVERFRRITGDDVADLLEHLARSADADYEPVGPLTYTRKGQHPVKDMDARQEAILSKERSMALLVAGANLWENHHMYNYLEQILGVSPNDSGR